MIEEKRDKQFYEQRASDEMAQHVISADYDVRQKLARAGRPLAREDHESGLAGQITERAARPGTFTLPGRSSETRETAPSSNA